jgi:hypothetical protein
MFSVILCRTFGLVSPKKLRCQNILHFRTYSTVLEIDKYFYIRKFRHVFCVKFA